MSIKKISSNLTIWDKWNNFLVRSSFNRNDYIVEPGIYALGNPTPDSPVMVSANYKLSFDVLRAALKGLDVWILVLDTKGVNVWCSAGKGTFGSEELVNRIDKTKLNEVVKHRRLILPQLAATGVAAHEVKKRSGFVVTYGPVRAEDLQAFLQAGKRATPKMREVTFSFKERLLLVPVEVVQGFRYFLIPAIVLFFIAGIVPVINLLAAYFAGAVLGPLLLPWLPGRAFSLKGFYAGLMVVGLLFIVGVLGSSPLEVIAWGLIITSLASFLTMNFTGASTYTSPSGVVKEMRLAMPIQIAVFVIGLILWLIGRFIL
ncbi:mercury methylation corrinoid protein HgcA [Candidatus Margulisiibacteriota bacterium]